MCVFISMQSVTDKKIYCCIPWAEYADFPLVRKLIKEKLSKCMHKIRIVISSYPEGMEISHQDSQDFINWLKNDLGEYAEIHVITMDDVPQETKWSGNLKDHNYKHGYSYPFEVCVDDCDVDYIARIETDFVTSDWDKIETILNEDFDLITTGQFHRELVDISCIIAKKETLLSLEDLRFDETTKRSIKFAGNGLASCSGNNQDVYCLFDRQKGIISNLSEQKDYDQLQWALMQFCEKSDKVYIINSNVVEFKHYLGMNIRLFGHLRNVQMEKGHDDKFLQYIERLKSEIDIDNYNLFPPYKKLIENYCDVYK